MVRSPQELSSNNSVDLANAINETNLVETEQINGLISIDTNVSLNNTDCHKSPGSNNLSDKRKQHNCPYCDRSFTRPYRLSDHISFSHTDEKKYMCSLCSKNFSCKDKLKHHIDVKHENKKPNVKTKAKAKNVEDLKCEYPGCTKTFANKYNVKRHIENVHLKVKRKHNKSSSSNCSINNNSDSNPNNSSTDINLSASTSVTTGSHQNHKSNSSISSTISQVVNTVNQSNSKIEPTNTSTPVVSNKQISKLTNKNIIQTSLNLNSPNGILNNTTPLTLLATSNGIGGITLTTLGSIHHQQQQQQQQQHQVSNSQVVTTLGLTPLSNGNTTFLTLNPLIIQPQQQIIYQSPNQMPVLSNNNMSQNGSSNGLMIKNSNINLNCLNTIQSNPVETNFNPSITMTDQNSIVNLNSNFNQVTLTTAQQTELVNSILIKSEQQHEQSLVQDCHGLITFTDLDNNHNDNETIQNYQHNDLNQNLQNDENEQKMLDSNEKDDDDDDDDDQNHQQIEDEKDGKIYTCARCPEIFNSSKQLRKHVSENHEKEYECCICNLNFNNRFTFLKHKYYHINIESSKINLSERKNEKNCTQSSSDLSSDEDEINKEDKSENIFDLNSLYKRSLSNLETLLNLNVAYSTSSQQILNVIKSKKNLKENVDSFDKISSSGLVKMIRQSSSCDICMKCFGKKTKLLAHRRLCEAKYGNARKSLLFKKQLKKKTSMNSKSNRKKQKLDTSSDSLVDGENEEENQLKDLTDSNSINLNFLFD